MDVHRAEIDAFLAGSTKQPEAVLMAESAEGKAIGFVELSLRSYAEGCDTSPVAYLEGWFVENAYRRRGIGGALVEAAEDWGRRQGCTEFASDAPASNDTSRVSHLGLGFEEAGLIRCFRKSL